MKIDMQKVSRIAAKTSLRLFIILILAGCVPFISNSKRDHMSFIVHSAWTFISPAVLVVAFIVLLIVCLKNRYSKTDVNWLFTLDTLILITYGVTLYIHLFRSVLH